MFVSLRRVDSDGGRSIRTLDWTRSSSLLRVILLIRLIPTFPVCSLRKGHDQ
jgi:hypothetical protein